MIRHAHPFIHPPRCVPRLLHGIYRRVGYRGLALCTFGAMFALIGASAITSSGIVPPDPNLLHTKLPLWARFVIWSVLGTFAFTMGVARNRWRPLGFAALFIGPFERFLSYFGAVAETGNLRYLTGFALYLVLAITVVLFAAWPEPPDEVEALVDKIITAPPDQPITELLDTLGDDTGPDR